KLTRPAAVTVNCVTGPGGITPAGAGSATGRPMTTPRDERPLTVAETTSTAAPEVIDAGPSTPFPSADTPRSPRSEDSESPRMNVAGGVLPPACACAVAK